MSSPQAPSRTGRPHVRAAEDGDNDHPDPEQCVREEPDLARPHCATQNETDPAGHRPPPEPGPEQATAENRQPEHSAKLPSATSRWRTTRCPDQRRSGRWPGRCHRHEGSLRPRLRRGREPPTSRKQQRSAIARQAALRRHASGSRIRRRTRGTPAAPPRSRTCPKSASGELTECRNVMISAAEPSNAGSCPRCGNDRYEEQNHRGEGGEAGDPRQLLQLGHADTLGRVVTERTRAGALSRTRRDHSAAPTPSRSAVTMSEWAAAALAEAAPGRWKQIKGSPPPHSGIHDNGSAVI